MFHSSPPQKKPALSFITFPEYFYSALKIKNTNTDVLSSPKGAKISLNIGQHRKMYIPAPKSLKHLGLLKTYRNYKHINTFIPPKLNFSQSLLKIRNSRNYHPPFFSLCDS